MLTYPNINPVAVKLGPFTIYWYGLMYLMGFLGVFGYCYQRRLSSPRPWKRDEILDVLFYGALGVIFGGTWGYWIFYEPRLLLADPGRLLRFWEPGRSFHGGLLGVLIAISVFCRLHQRKFWEVTDFIAPAIPIGIATGRLGNFLNGELWGRITKVPWGMVFPQAGSFPRHPSQLYELGLEGVGLFVLLHWYSKKPRAPGRVSGLFLCGYGFLRFVAEFFREPDINLGFIALGWMTMGQLLSLLMMLIGIIILILSKKRMPCNSI